MPKRRDAVAPQTTDDVFIDEITKLKADLRQLKQTGPSSMQPDDYEDGVDPAPWETVLHWPIGSEDHTTARSAPAVPWDTAVFYFPGWEDPLTGEEVEAGWKALSSYSVYCIKVFGDSKPNKIENGAAKFPIHPRHDGAKIRAVRIWNGIVGAGATTVQLTNTTRGITLLSTPATISSGQFIGSNAVVDTGGDPADPNNKVYEDDMIWINVTAAVGKGLGVYVDVA